MAFMSELATAPPRYLSPAEVASRLGVSERHLAHLRQSRRGPPHYVLGYRTVRYLADEVDAWAASLLADRQVAS